MRHFPTLETLPSFLLEQDQLLQMQVSESLRNPIKNVLLLFFLGNSEKSDEVFLIFPTRPHLTEYISDPLLRTLTNIRSSYTDADSYFFNTHA